MLSNQEVTSMPDAAATQAPRERFLAEDRKNQIVQTALLLVNDHGVDAVSTQLIADTIGRSQGVVFRHFPTKEALWNSVFDWLREQLEAVWTEARRFHDSASPLQTLERMFRAHIKLIEEYPGLAKLVMSDHLRHEYPGLNERFGELHRRYERQVTALIEEGVRSKNISPAIKASDAATLYFCMIQGLGFQFAIARIRPSHLKADAARLFRLWVSALAEHRNGSRKPAKASRRS
jgi:AcrR family transcriptional regulator